MKNELKTLSAKVDKLWELLQKNEITREDFIDRLVAHRILMEQTLHLGHFVPTDSEGNVLEEPVNADNYNDKVRAYQAAKDAVLFEGWEVDPKRLNIRGCIGITNGNIDLIFYSNGIGISKIILEDVWTDFEKIETLNDLAEATKDNPIKLKTKVDSKPVKIGEVWQDMRGTGYKRVITDRNIDKIKANKQHFKYVCEQPHKDGDFSYSCTFNHCRCKN